MTAKAPSNPRPILVNMEPYEIVGRVLEIDTTAGNDSESWGRLLLEEEPTGTEGEADQITASLFAYPLNAAPRVGMRLSGLLANADGTYALTDLQEMPEPQFDQPGFPVSDFQKEASAILRITAPRRAPADPRKAIADDTQQMELIA